MSTMFDSAFEALPDKPQAISKELYRERQERLLSQFDVGDLVILSSLPEATRSNDVHYQNLMERLVQFLILNFLMTIAWNSNQRSLGNTELMPWSVI